MKTGLFLLAGFILAVIFLAGCTQQTPAPVCTQVTAFGVDAQGNCQQFPTSCLPDGYTKVDQCINPCANVACPDKCSGTTFLSNGRCESGECVFDSARELSVDCGYKNFDLNVQATLRSCEYSRSQQTMTLFLSVKNLGKPGPKPGSSVWLVSPDLNKKIYQPVNYSYNAGLSWWQDVFTSRPYKGPFFEVFFMPQFVDMDYKFVYCELENNDTGTCSEQNGFVLYSGDTNSDCNVIS